MRISPKALLLVAALTGCAGAPSLAQTSPAPSPRAAPAATPAPAARPPAAPATQGRPRLTEVCAQNIQRFCPQVALGQGRVTRCLMRRKNQLQRSCRLFIRRLAPVPR